MLNNSTLKLSIATAMMTVWMSASATDYTYRSEGFEGAEWSKAAATVESATGTWTSNKNVADSSTANSGSNSVVFTSKNGLTLPRLSRGAGFLIYSCRVTNRQVSVEVSTDNATWTNVESYKTTAEWSRHIVPIHDSEVRYVRISINSNKQFNIDDVLVTLPDGTDADGNQLVTSVDLPYFTQTFENTTQYPKSKPESSDELKFEVEGQGEWLYSNAYRGSNADYIIDGSKSDLRMLKNGSYVVTPVLSQGVMKVQLNEGRAAGKDLSIYTSADGGVTWTLASTQSTQEEISVTLADRNANRVKIANESGSDFDIDNLTVTAFPEGTPATLASGEATDISASKATLNGTLLTTGDRSIIERGVCWSSTELPTVADACVQAEGTGLGDYAVAVTGLPASTTIYYRAYALSLAGDAYGEVRSFVTPAPTLADIAILKMEENAELTDEEVIYQTVTIDIRDNGGAAIEAVGACYSTDGTLPTVEGNSVESILYPGLTTFTADLPMQPLTTYRVRGWVRTVAGVAYTSEQELTTSALVVPDYAHRVYYCSPEGVDATADGSLSAPYLSLQKAADRVEAGDTIYLLAGTYAYSERINLSTIGAKNSGTIVVKALGGRAVLDFSAMEVADANQGIRLTGSYWHFYGLDICNAGDNGMLIERNKPSGGTYADVVLNDTQAHHNVIEFCRFYRCADTGLQIKNLGANNRIINCDSYFNIDPGEGNADGFAVKLSHGSGNYFYGCRAWANSDDGWDQFVKTDGGFPDDQTTTYDNCWAFNNGYLEDGREGSGNGNGFKMGSALGRNNVILNRCLAFNNLMKSFDQNHNSGNMILNNCSSYTPKNSKNAYTYHINEGVATGREVRLTNCLAIGDGLSQTKSAYGTADVAGTTITCDFEASPSDFVSIDFTGADGERGASGELPELDFMKIRPGNTRLIDAGTPVQLYLGESIWSKGITYEGAAPDLGCFETGTSTSGIAAIVGPSQCHRLEVLRAECGLLFVSIAGASATESHTLDLYTTGGQLLRSYTIEGPTTQLDCSGLPSGVFLLNLRGTRDGVKIRR